MAFRLAIAVSTTAVFTAASFAAPVEGNKLLEQGTFTFGLASGGWHRYSRSDSPSGSWSAFSLSPTVGVFAADRIWLGGGVTLSEWDLGPEWGKHSANSVHGGIDYHFLSGKWTPFVGFWGLLGDLPGDGVMPRLGARFFVVPRTSLGVGYDGAVTFHTYDYEYADTTEVRTVHRLWYGFQVYF
jgi:hypothetical protein